jgi:hypothetical protein
LPLARDRPLGRAAFPIVSRLWGGMRVLLPDFPISRLASAWFILGVLSVAAPPMKSDGAVDFSSPWPAGFC